MEVTDRSYSNFTNLLWQQSRDTAKIAAVDIFHSMPICVQNFIKKLKEYNARSLWQSCKNVSFEDIKVCLEKIKAYAQRNYFAIFAITAGSIVFRPLIGVILVTLVKIICLLLRTPVNILHGIAGSIFQSMLKWTSFAILAKTVFHMGHESMLHSFFSSLAQIVDPLSVFLMKCVLECGSILIVLKLLSNVLISY
ncbi:MAG: hypothetical protein LBB16_01170 [Puniceicoccales bacterium]|jgi:hypothetical protein|nr:hypothetical protein [Puniceicoccales bacterium]